MEVEIEEPVRTGYSLLYVYPSERLGTERKTSSQDSNREPSGRKWSVEAVCICFFHVTRSMHVPASRVQRALQEVLRDIYSRGEKDEHARRRYGLYSVGQPAEFDRREDRVAPPSLLGTFSGASMRLSSHGWMGAAVLSAR